MIVVTGTKRSGTSMWMQVLVAAGFPIIGEQFPARWKEDIGAANPDGFFESPLRRGVFGPAALDPLTGNAMDPGAFRRHAVKIFVPGVVRTKLDYLNKVIGSVRDFREYEDSRRRMWRMEDEALRARSPEYEPQPRLEPVHEWWSANYVLLVDALRRRYDLKLIAYDTILEQPEATIREALRWLGGGDLSQALQAVKPQHRTQRARPTPRGVEPAVVAVFDELYDLVRSQRALTRPLVSKLEAVNQTLLPRLKADVSRVRSQFAARRKQRPGGSQNVSHDDGSEFDLFAPRGEAGDKS